MNDLSRKDRNPIVETDIETDANAEANYFKPRRDALAAYDEALTRFHLDGFVYPATQMPPPDETMPQKGEPGNLAASIPADCPSGWRSPADRGATATCSATLTPTSSRRTTEGRRSWSNRVSFRTRVRPTRHSLSWCQTA
jgi:hypothetical protein